MKIFANLLLSAALLALPSLSAPAERVTAVYTSIAAAYAPFWVAKDKGIFDKYGLDASLVYMRGTVPTIAALANNDIEFVQSGAAPFINYAARGGDVTLLRATEIEPRGPNYWNNLASAYRETRQFNLAVAALDSNMKLAAPHGTWTDWHNLGIAYRNLGLMWGNERDRQNKAVLAFRQSLKLNPRNAEGWNSLGATYQTLSNYDEAFRCYKRAEALGNPYAAQNYANLKSALAAAARAQANSGNNPSSDGGGNPCSSYSGPVAAACNQGDRSAIDRYQNNQPTQEDRRKYGVQ